MNPAEVIFSLSRKPRSDSQKLQKELGMLNGVELGVYVLQNNISTTLNLSHLVNAWSDVRCDPEVLTVSIAVQQGCEDCLKEIVELLNNKAMHRCSNHSEVILRYRTDSKCALSPSRH